MRDTPTYTSGIFGPIVSKDACLRSSKVNPRKFGPMMSKNSTPIIGIARRIILPSIPSIGRVRRALSECSLQFGSSGYWRNPALFRYSDWLEHQIALGTGRLSLSLCSVVDLGTCKKQASDDEPCMGPCHATSRSNLGITHRFQINLLRIFLQAFHQCIIWRWVWKYIGLLMAGVSSHPWHK
jgi:hypothetical protein